VASIFISIIAFPRTHEEWHYFSAIAGTSVILIWDDFDHRPVVYLAIFSRSLFPDAFPVISRYHSSSLSVIRLFFGNQSRSYLWNQLRSESEACRGGGGGGGGGGLFRRNRKRIVSEREAQRSPWRCISRNVKSLVALYSSACGKKETLRALDPYTHLSPLIAPAKRDERMLGGRKREEARGNEREERPSRKE